MRSVTVTLLLAFIEQVYVTELVAHSTKNVHELVAKNSSNAQVSVVDNLVEKVIDRLLNVWPIHRTNVEDNTLAMIHRGILQSRSVISFNRIFRAAPLLRNRAQTRSLQARAEVEAASAAAALAGIKWEKIAAGVNFVLAPLLVWYFFVTPGGREAPSELRGAEQLMDPKACGTCPQPVQQNLRWDCDWKTADRICCYNRHFAEGAGYFQQTSFLPQEKNADEQQPVTFYDSVTGKPLFVAPKGRSWDDFVRESLKHGWPSFRDAEVVTDNVRVLDNGETISVDGTHLGHNLPDGSGNRYCINLVSVAGQPETAKVND